MKKKKTDAWQPPTVSSYGSIAALTADQEDNKFVTNVDGVIVGGETVGC